MKNPKKHWVANPFEDDPDIDELTIDSEPTSAKDKHIARLETELDYLEQDLERVHTLLTQAKQEAANATKQAAKTYEAKINELNISLRDALRINARLTKQNLELLKQEQVTLNARSLLDQPLDLRRPSKPT